MVSGLLQSSSWWQCCRTFAQCDCDAVQLSTTAFHDGSGWHTITPRLHRQLNRTRIDCDIEFTTNNDHQRKQRLIYADIASGPSVKNLWNNYQLKQEMLPLVVAPNTLVLIYSFQFRSAFFRRNGTAFFQFRFRCHPQNGTLLSCYLELWHVISTCESRLVRVKVKPSCKISTSVILFETCPHTHTYTHGRATALL